MAGDGSKVYDKDGVVCKECTRCHEIKPLEAFSKNIRNVTHGRQPKCKACNNHYYQEHDEQKKASSNKWYYENLDKAKSTKKAYLQIPENKAKKLAWDKAYYHKHRDEAIAYAREWGRRNKEKRRINYKNWYYRNLEWARLCNRIKEQKRRYLCIKNGNNTLTVEQAKELLEKHPFCDYCGAVPDKLAIDHVKPLIKGGQNCIGNVTAACPTCNSSKGGKLLDEWCIILNDDSPIKHRIQNKGLI